MINACKVGKKEGRLLDLERLAGKIALCHSFKTQIDIHTIKPRMFR